MLKAYGEDHLKYKNLKTVNSHGDYNRLQLLCDIAKNKINAVIDFSGAASVRAVWEIIRSYSYGAKECINGSNIDLIKFKKYIEKYLKYGKLDLFDISNMAGFYYYNLLRSTYGLNSENRNLNDFAIWRTGLCQCFIVNHIMILTCICLMSLEEMFRLILRCLYDFYKYRQ